MFKLSAERPAKLVYAKILPLAMASFLLNGCATATKDTVPDKGLEASENIAAGNQSAAERPGDASGNTGTTEKDPLEGFNRTMFGFNDKVDTYIAEPITTAYKWVTPEFLQTGISNFYTNTKAINVVLNDVLQGKMLQSAQDTGRFLVNTTAGVGGLFDVAKHIGLELHEEDFDQTLAVWGVSKGAYLVLPLLGPTTTRGLPGSVVDTAANPVTYVGWPVQALGVLNERANAEGALKFIDEAALDPYVFTRESFLQWRDHLATDGAAKPDAGIDEFEDELDENVAEQDGDGKSAAAASQPEGKKPRLQLSTPEKNDATASAQNQFATPTDRRIPSAAALPPSTANKLETQNAENASTFPEQRITAPW